VSAARAFLDHFVRTHAPTLRWKKPTVACAVPWEAGAFDLRTLGDCLSGAGVSRRRTVPGHMAALWGWNSDFARRCGLLVLDIGAGTTDIAVVSLGRTIAARSLRCAGDAMTAAIVAHFKRNHGFQIGEASAEAAKVRYGTACPESGGADETVVLQGKCRLRGVPVLREFPRSELALALSAPLERIIAGVVSTLAEVPPDVAASVFDGPAALSGGGALLDGLDRVFAARLGVGMRLADEPQFCVLRGLERMAAGESDSTPFARSGDPDFPHGDPARSLFLRRRAAA
jgi:rod shape-determining protein MreB